jgi:hypothetical protein
MKWNGNGNGNGNGTGTGTGTGTKPAMAGWGFPAGAFFFRKKGVQFFRKGTFPEMVVFCQNGTIF